MGSFSDFLEDELLDHVFVASYTSPEATIYVALSLSTVLDASVSSAIPGEVTGGAYARKLCETWDTASGGSTKNSQAITFAQATAAWGTVIDFAICDSINAAAGTNMLAYGTLSTSKSVDSGDTPKFDTGDLKVTLG